jgi:uncharacterized iron-regulated membrane protein
MSAPVGALLLGMVIGAVAAAGMLVWWDRRRGEDSTEAAAREAGE